ncbi:MAG TPA: WD40 repeat domain-containing serine/threonine protein kinase [Gemmatimonadaceae bacterium]|nr:WD40 repeat domain-containing serine/threonine protein kinase [Gemmatimonadaceae bacterium]
MSDQLARITSALSDRYRIERELGAGGMATVYLAEDLKHNRMVAVKVLKPELAVAIGADRFLAEIKTTANLQHPHILALHDSGEINGTVFYVMPYVEGESLRDRLDREKQLPVDDALRIAGEVADALQYAHERGVIHRDIKPENILLQRGHAVVADFGIALAASKTGGARMTETGMSLGTPTYMSPEQAMGSREVDARTDIYSLGCVLYEMLAGEPPFVGPTAQSIVAKVITEKPKSLTAQRHTVPPHVDDVVQTALEKLAADRFASATMFADALRKTGSARHVSSHRSARAASGPATFTEIARRWAIPGIAALVLIAGAYMLGRRSTTGSSAAGLAMDQKTYGTQVIFTARYTTSGDAVVYSAAQGGSSPSIYTLTSAYPLPRAITGAATQLLSVSSRDEMAVLVGAVLGHHRVFTGTLARMPVGGGTPRELLTDVHDADWSPDAAQLAVVHEVNGKDRLEYPIGTVLYELSGSLSDLRFAPDGKHIAFNEHPDRGDDRGTVAVIDLKGNHKILTPQYLSLEGLAWTPDSKRLVYSASQLGGIYSVNDVALTGGITLGVPGVGNAIIQDIGRNGNRLISREDLFKRVWIKRASDNSPTDVSWLDVSFFPNISSDGTLLAYGDGSSVSGENYATMLQRTDGSPAVRIGDGAIMALSSDNKSVLTALPTSPMQLMNYPTGPGSPRRIDTGSIAVISSATFLGTDGDVLICGSELKRSVRCYVRSSKGGPLRAVTPEGTGKGISSPDGKSIIASGADGYRMFAVADGTPQTIRGLVADDRILRFSPDSKALWVRRGVSQPVHIDRLELASGARTPLIPDFSPRRPGVLNTLEVSLADDPRTYAYMEREVSSFLFELKGIKK